MKDENNVQENGFVNVKILVKSTKNGKYEDIFMRAYGLPSTPRKGDFIRVDECRYEVEYIEFETDASCAHVVCAYVKAPTQSGAIFF